MPTSLIMLNRMPTHHLGNSLSLSTLLCDYKNFIISIGNRLPKIIIIKIEKNNNNNTCISFSISLSRVKMNILLLFLCFISGDKVKLEF